MQENNFLVFKKSMRKHIFKTSNIFVHKKCSKTCKGIGRMQHTKKNIFLYFFIENTSNAIKHKRKITIKAKSRHIYSKIYNKLKAIIKKSNPTHPTQTAKTKIKLGAITKKKQKQWPADFFSSGCKENKRKVPKCNSS